MRITPGRIAAILGPSPKPENIWEKQFDYSNDKLRAMALMD
jgi:hypothetical protein